jgi:hypothetical protein
MEWQKGAVQVVPGFQISKQAAKATGCQARPDQDDQVIAD